MKLLVINGPNLNMLGKRDPEMYGRLTLQDIRERVEKRAKELGVEIAFFQANGEGQIIDFIQQNTAGAQGIIINPGAYTHYAYALRDALADTRLPIIEVHLSNVQAREEFRHKSLVAPIAWGSIVGLGWRGYVLALEALAGKDKEA